MRFAKGHGTENDFVILPDPDGAVDLTGTLAARLCDRRAGVGGDGVLRATRVASSLAGANGGAEWFMDYRNADGSLAEMCGNGIRVFARYLIEHGLTASDEFGVATRAGTRQVRAEPDGAITVDMGLPRVLGPGRALLAGQPFDGLAVSLGNPHLACIAGDPLDSFDLSRPPVLDPGQFPEGANFELVRIAGAGHIEMRVYERGCGPTRSCGTGAVAAAVAAATVTAPAATVTAPAGAVTAPAGAVTAPAGAVTAPAATVTAPAAAVIALAGAPVPAGTWTVDLPGGRLRVILGRETSFLSGPAVIVAEGELDERWLSERPGFPPQSSPAA